jgi:hypothetical protein
MPGEHFLSSWLPIPRFELRTLTDYNRIRTRTVDYTIIALNQLNVFNECHQIIVSSHSFRFYCNFVYLHKRNLWFFMTKWNKIRLLPKISERYIFFLIFTIAPCIPISIQFTHQQMHFLLNLENFKIYIKITLCLF